MRIGIDDRFARKNSRPNPSTAANHLVLIRSFLIDSDPSAPSRAVNCAKVFCCAQKHTACARALKFGTHARIFASHLRAAREMRTRKKSLFHRGFCNVDDVRAMRRDVFTQRLHQTTCNACARVNERRIGAVYTFR
jgi:hypothetical protein